LRDGDFRYVSIVLVWLKTVRDKTEKTDSSRTPFRDAQSRSIGHRRNLKCPRPAKGQFRLNQDKVHFTS
jgi:hypothetical protein